MNFDEREANLQARSAYLDKLEAEIKAREKSIRKKESEKKQVLLRLAPSLWNEIARWADDDIRSINGQIEYLLTEAVRTRRSTK